MFRRAIPLILICLLISVFFAEGQTNRVDLRPDFARWKFPIKKQGARNTCSVFTTTAAMEYALSKKQDRRVLLSEEYLNWACNQVIGNTTQDRGQFFSHLLKGFEKYGICSSSNMPYASKFNASYEPSATALAEAKELQKIGFKAHWIKPNDGKVGVSDEHIAQIKEVLRKGLPVCAGSYHSVLIVGFHDSAAVSGGGIFFLRDSGGGNETTMTYEVAKKRLCDLLWYEIR